MVLISNVVYNSLEIRDYKQQCQTLVIEELYILSGGYEYVFCINNDTLIQILINYVLI